MAIARFVLQEGTDKVFINFCDAKIQMDTPSGVKGSIPAWIKFSVKVPGEIPYNGIYYDPPEEMKTMESPLLHSINCPKKTGHLLCLAIAWVTTKLWCMGNTEIRTALWMPLIWSDAGWTSSGSHLLTSKLISNVSQRTQPWSRFWRKLVMMKLILWTPSAPLHFIHLLDYRWLPIRE